MSHGNNEHLATQSLSLDFDQKLDTTAVWNTFTRLVHELDASRNGAQQIKATLEAIRTSIDTGAVCWYNEVSGEIIGPCGDSTLSPEACRRFSKGLLAKHPENKGAILWTHRQTATAASPNAPLSAAAIRVHRSRPGWIIAVSFEKSHLLDAQCVRIIGLAAAMLVKQHHQSRSYARIKDSLVGFVHCLAAVVDARDTCTAGHSERVSRIAVCIARRMNLSSQVLSDLHIAGILHDVGKIGVRDNVLLKEGKLTTEEYLHMQAHVVTGDQIVSTIKEFSRLRAGVRHHHERYDGKGYPDGLAGEDIPLLGRILAVADSCDAMMCTRRYRNALPLLKMDAEFLIGAGSQWDPKVVDCFMRCRDEIYGPIIQKGIGESVDIAIEEILKASKDGSSANYRLPPPRESQGPGGS